MSKRTFSRVLFNAPVLIECDGRKYYGKIENVSHGGMLVITSAILPVGSRVEVFLKYFKSNSRMSMIIPCKVARKIPEGIGLTSPQIDSQLIIRMENILAEKGKNYEQMMAEICSFTQEGLPASTLLQSVDG